MANACNILDLELVRDIPQHKLFENIHDRWVFCNAPVSTWSTSSKDCPEGFTRAGQELSPRSVSLVLV